MEPDLEGQEKSGLWDPLHECELVAMEPDLGGQEKSHHKHPQQDSHKNVAMEPDLGGQEKFPGSEMVAVTSMPSQWSLTLEVRKSEDNAQSPTSASASQWSLTLEVRKSRAKAQSYRRVLFSRNGA